MIRILSSQSAANTEVKKSQDVRIVKAWSLLQSGKDEVRKIRRNYYLVKSQTKQKFYNVRKLKEGGWTCDCPDFVNRNIACKHVLAVQLKLSGRGEPQWSQKKIA